MIDREAVRETIVQDLQGMEVGLSHLEKIDHKIDATKDVIKDLELMIDHSEGVSRIILKWHLEYLEDNLSRCEILREISHEIYIQNSG